jgi:hypothetical protein
MMRNLDVLDRQWSWEDSSNKYDGPERTKVTLPTPLCCILSGETLNGIC